MKKLYRRYLLIGIMAFLINGCTSSNLPEQIATPKSFQFTIPKRKQLALVYFIYLYKVVGGYDCSGTPTVAISLNGIGQARVLDEFNQQIASFYLKPGNYKLTANMLLPTEAPVAQKVSKRRADISLHAKAGKVYYINVYYYEKNSKAMCTLYQQTLSMHFIPSSDGEQYLYHFLFKSWKEYNYLKQANGNGHYFGLLPSTPEQLKFVAKAKREFENFRNKLQRPALVQSKKNNRN